MAAYDVLLDQALQLSDEERGKLAARLFKSLDPDDDDELSPEQWDAAWSAELDRRIREVREGTVELVDGDEMLAELDEIASRP
jgi:putative addiction module component (TIGR02574 family)